MTQNDDAVADPPHSVKQPVISKKYTADEWVSFALFWLLAVVVFLQFFTRFFVQLPLYWTEEMARVLLIALSFAGASMAVRRNSHVYVGVLYWLLPKSLGRFCSTLIDLCQIGFYGVCAYLMAKVAFLMAPQRIASIDVSLAVLFGFVALAFGVASIRAGQVAWRHWRAGTSEIESGLVDSKL